MKKLTFHSTLNHKAHGYEPMQIEVEKVITLYGKRFEQLKKHPLDDVPELIENRATQLTVSAEIVCSVFSRNAVCS